MPLHVNLYHEVQRQELARRRDPLRLGMMGLAVIATGFVAYYFVMLEQAHQVGTQYEALQDEYSRLQPKAAAAKAREDELNAEISASDTLVKNINGRFYWAPVLDQILKTVPRTVQLTHFSASTPGTAPGTVDTIQISGISSAIEPRKEAEALRTALNSRLGTQFDGVSAVFKTLDDTDEVVMLDGRRLATANFNIEIKLQARDPATAATAPAPARNPKLIAAQ
jgi:Tfp pilus assembly protein PilN